MINDRMFELIKHFADGNKRRFSQLTNLSPSVIENLVGSRQGKPSFDVLEKIILAFADINTGWLMTGRGKMLLSNPKNVTLSHAEIMEYKTPHAVPFFDLPISAGAPGVIDLNQAKRTPDGYIDIEIFRHCEAVIPVIGMNMEPEIKAGDLLGITQIPGFSEKWDFLQTGKIYLIVTHQERLIKYIKESSDPQFIVCESPDYGSFKIHKSDILQLYRVVASIRAH